MSGPFAPGGTERIMTADESTNRGLERFLAEPVLAIIVTNGRDGHPHPTPVWFLHEPTRSVTVLAVAGSVKAHNIRTDPRVAVLISNEERPERWVMLRGSASVSNDPALIEDQMLRISQHYLGEREGAAYAAAWPRPLNFVSITIPDPAISTWRPEIGEPEL